MSIQLQQIEVIENHSRLNEKQRKIEESLSISIDDYKTKILCLQCSKESEKNKCEQCVKENIDKRNSYLIFSGTWTISSIIVFFSSNIYFSIPVGLCCGTVLTSAYNTIKNF